MGDWHKVELQEDIDFLMETYGGFHDSCIVSLSFQSGAFVDNDMAMHFGGAQTKEYCPLYARVNGSLKQ